MSQPEVVTEHLDAEQAVAEVGLGGEDHLYVTPTRTLIYRAEGLLSDETVEEYPHDAEVVTVSESRRKAKVSLDYGLDGERTFAVPKAKLDQVLHPVLAGILNAADITEPGETVKRTFRFSELTLVVTSARVVKHIGQNVWDDDYEEFHFDDVTDLGFEEGSVATSVVLTVNGRQERFKAPTEQARAVEEAITDALVAHVGADSLEAFRARSADEEPEDIEENVSFGEGPDPLSTNVPGPEELETDVDVDEGAAGGGDEGTTTAVAGSAAEASGGGQASEAGQHSEADQASAATGATTTGRTESGSEGRGESDLDRVAGTDVQTSTEVESSGGDVRQNELAAEVTALRDTVEAQTEALQRQSDLIERLIEELRQGR